MRSSASAWGTWRAVRRAEELWDEAVLPQIYGELQSWIAQEDKNRAWREVEGASNLDREADLPEGAAGPAAGRPL